MCGGLIVRSSHSSFRCCWLLERDFRFGRAVLVRCSFDSSIAVISIEACDVAA